MRIRSANSSVQMRLTRFFKMKKLKQAGNYGDGDGVGDGDGDGDGADEVDSFLQDEEVEVGGELW